MTRAELGMPEGFAFLFVFDYRSVFRRKNPLGLVEAFRRAFEPGEGPSLVIKSIFGEQFPAQREQLAEAIVDRPEIHLIEDNVSRGRQERDDCQLRLLRLPAPLRGAGADDGRGDVLRQAGDRHRLLGQPRLHDAGEQLPGPGAPTRIGPGAAPYDPDSWWADPDLDFAARVMRDVVNDPAVRTERAQRGAADIRLTHSPEAAADWLEARIAESRAEGVIAHLRHPGLATSDSASKEDLEHLLGFGGMPPVGEGGKGRRSAKRAYNRVIRPYAAHQHQVNIRGRPLAG